MTTPRAFKVSVSQKNFRLILKTIHINTILARAVGVAVGRRSSGRLATTLVATKNVFILPSSAPEPAKPSSSYAGLR